LDVIKGDGRISLQSALNLVLSTKNPRDLPSKEIKTAAAALFLRNNLSKTR